MLGTAGADVLAGTPGRDVICGLGGRDTLIGRAGADFIGGAGLTASSAALALTPSSAAPAPTPSSAALAPTSSAGRGRDVLYARDRRKDRVLGGPGFDPRPGRHPQGREEVGHETNKASACPSGRPAGRHMPSMSRHEPACVGV